jgi:uncharacterized protein YbjT (DUF2867 family)
MARLLIVGGGCRGRQFAREAVRQGHAARIVTRLERGRGPIEAAGAECWIGDPDRLGTLRGAFEGVAVACWLLGTATGPEERLRALHGPRLRAFTRQLLDTTVRGLLYEASGPSQPQDAFVEGERIVSEVALDSSIPLAVLRTDPVDVPRWLAEARGAVDAMLSDRPTRARARVAAPQGQVHEPDALSSS